MEVWKEIDNGAHEGRNLIVKIAILILSVIANSAGCERLFSQMGIVHTKLRNQLRLEQVRKIVVLKTVLQDTHWTKSSSKRRHQRQLGVSASDAKLVSGDQDSDTVTLPFEEDGESTWGLSVELGNQSP